MSSTALALGLTLSFYDKISAPLKAARGTINSTSQAASALQQQLANTSGLAKQAARLDALKTKTLEYNEQISQAKRRVAELSTQMDTADKPSKKLQSALAAAQRSLAQLTEGSYRHRARLQALQQTLEQGGVSTKHLTAEQARLRGEMNQLTESIKRNNEAAARAAKLRANLSKAAAITAGAGTLATGAGMLARPAFNSSVQAFADMENAAVRLKSSMTDATGQISPLFQQIDGLAQNLGAALPGSTRDFYAMFEVMLNSGVDAKSIIDGVGESAAKLAMVLNVSYDEAARAVSRLKNATGVADANMMGFLDTIQRTKSLGVDLGEMEYAFSRSGGKLKELNIQGLAAANTMSVLYASWIRSGLSGETVGTGFAAVLNSMQQLAFGTSKKSEDARKMLKELGIELALFDAKGNFKGVDNMVSQLDKLRTLDPAALNQVLTQIFGTGTDAQMVAALIKDGRAGFDKLTQELNNKASLATKANMQTATLANLWESVGGTWDNLKAKLIGSIQGELKNAVAGIAQFQNTLNGLMDAFPGVTHAAALLFAAIAIGGPIVGGMAIGIAGLLKVMAFAGPGFAVMATLARGLGTAILFVGRALLMNPIGLILTGIGVAAFLVWQNWDTVKAKLISAWQSLAGAATGTFNAITGVVSSAWQGITSVTNSAWNGLSAFLSGLWEQIKTAFAGGIGGVSELIVNWSPLGLFYQAFAGVLSYFDIELPSKFTEFGRNLINGLGAGIDEKIQWVKDKILGLANLLPDWFKNQLGIHSPSRVFAELGGFIAEGVGVGINDKAKLALNAVGRMGALLPGALPTALAMGLTTAPMQASMAGMANPGAQSITNHIHITVTAPQGSNADELARLIAQKVEQVQRGQTVRGRSQLFDEV